MQTNRGDWIRRIVFIVFLGIVTIVGIKLGALELVNALADAGEESITITTTYTGEGAIEVWQGDTMLITGTGEITVPKNTDISIRLTCKDTYIIKKYQINQKDRSFVLGHEWQEEVKNVEDNLSIEVDFSECHTLTITPNENCEIEVSGAEYRREIEEKAICYYYTGDSVQVKIRLKKYWLMESVILNDITYNADNFEGFVQENDCYKIDIMPEQVQVLSLVLVKEMIPVTIIGGKGTLQINGITVVNGQQIDRCEHYNIVYSTTAKNIIIDYLYVNTMELDLSFNEDWTIGKCEYSTDAEYLYVDIDELSVERVSSIRQCFVVSKVPNQLYWLSDYSTIYTKQQDVALASIEGTIIKHICSTKNITTDKQSLSISGSGSISAIAVQVKLGTLLCTNPLQIVYDPDAPTITQYDITSHETDENGITPLDLTVQAKDIGEAGIDQLLCGTYEEYEIWKEKIAAGTYESLHEKAETQATITVTDVHQFATSDYYVWAIDCAANLSAPVKIDMIGPTLSCDTPQNWYNKDIVISGAANEEITNVYYSTSYDDYRKHTLQKNKGRRQSGSSKSTAWTCTIPATENKQQTYYMWAYDQYGNKSPVPYAFEAKIDMTAPELQLSRDLPEGQWSKDKLTIMLGAQDSTDLVNSGISRVLYSTNYDRSNPVVLTSPNSDGQYVLESPDDEFGQLKEMNQIYYFWAEDLAGNQSQVQKTNVQIDTKVPEITSVVINPKANTGHFTVREWGVCSQDPLVLTVQANDPGCSSGLGRMYLLQDGKKVGEAYGKNGSYDFILCAPFIGETSFVVEDLAGNISASKSISQLNSTLPSSRICMDKEVPKAELAFPLANYTDTQGRDWFSQNIEFSLSCEDKQSGIESVKVWLNGVELQQDVATQAFGEASAPDKTLQYRIATSQATSAEDGKYQIKVQMIDGCGNQTIVEQAIYMDTENPGIGQFTFTTRNTSVSQSNMVREDLYGYYFEDTTKVRIQGDDSKASSGIGKIAYYTVDYSNSKDGEKSTVVVKKADERGGIELVLNKGFKGQIYAMAIDHVGHTSGTYSKPYGVIIESVQSNSVTADVEIQLPATKCADAKGQPLFNQSVPLTFTAKDYFNGIAKIEWQVVSPHDTDKNQSGVFNVDGKGKVSGSLDSKSKISRELNLVTEISHILNVQNNSNDISIEVRITDRAGHTCMKKIVFSIDQTKPVLTMNIPENHLGEVTYYATPYQVEIEVQERNFDKDGIEAEITKNFNGSCQLSQWHKIENVSNPDLTTYKATVNCEEDGVYELKLQAKDLAGNTSAEKSGGLVIDTVRPKASVTFSGEAISHGTNHFYKQGQTATITIEEQNLDPSGIIMESCRYPSLQNHAVISNPTVSGFVTKGNIHTATIEFTEDGWYTLQIACKDKAGNSLEQEMQTAFGIDSKGPEIQIEGVQHQSAYNGELRPVITIRDENYDSKQVTLILAGSRQGETIIMLDSENVKIIENSISQTNDRLQGVTVTKANRLDASGSSLMSGHSIALDLFQEEQDKDDYYTLTIEATDAAGNTSSRTINFSVNRFGSVYSFSEALQQLSGKYVQSMGKVIFTETNVNALVKEETQIKLSRNGVVMDLVEDKDYSVLKVQNEGQWNQYIYEIEEQLFEEEGRYTLTIHTKDASGNVNENDVYSKAASIVFGVDKTKPIIASTNISADTTYGELEKQARFSISDNISLEHVSICLNDKEVPYRCVNDTYEIMIPGSNREQKLTIIATDGAGNETIRQMDNIYVTTSLWVRFWNNKVLVAIFFSVLALSVATVSYMVMRRKGK